MEYTIKKLAELPGISRRTLRYYDEIGLLKPKRINSAGYRIYGSQEIDRLQQILFFRRFDFSLEQIKRLLQEDQSTITTVLQEQYRLLALQRTELDLLLKNLAETITDYQGGTHMNDQQKFETMKQTQLAENTAKFGKEAREKYGQGAIDAADQHWGNMTAEQYQNLQQTEAKLFQALNQLLAEPNFQLDSPLAAEAFAAHKTWLTLAAPFYSAEYHRNLAELYLADERFAAYYNERTTKPSAQLLHDLILYYTK